MIGSIIGAVSGIGSAIAGGIGSARANRRRKKAIREAKQENANWYARRYNEDPLARSDTQRILNQTEDAVKRNNQRAQAQQAVVGGSEESVAATKQANAQALASAASSISANNDARKDEIEQSYRQQQSALDAESRGVQAQQAQNIATQTGTALNALGQVASSVDSAEAQQDAAKSVTPSQSMLTAKQKENLDKQVDKMNRKMRTDAASIFDIAYGATL